jgi:GTP-binding protein
MIRTDIRNVAIIAHVDHGKTTLVDVMLRQSGQFRDSQLRGQCILDSNVLERERGITILAKNIALLFGSTKINLIDTPGHADFGGEVERTIRMADGCLLLVDAFDGPMPQTRFVLSKAFDAGLTPIVVINKVDRPDARPREVLQKVYDLFIDLGANDLQLEFPYLFSSGKEGWASSDPQRRGDSIRPLFELIVERVPGPEVNPDVPLQMQVSALDWSTYVGRFAIGKILAGNVGRGDRVAVVKADRTVVRTIEKVFVFEKLGRIEVDRVEAGDVVALLGLDDVEIGDTVACVESPKPLPRIKVEDPTLTMLFTVNDSPLSGRDGQYVTSRHLRERLRRELDSNVALRLEDGERSDEYLVSGRGLLHLGILIETMRREGYELSVGKPHVILKSIDGRTCEPIELLLIDVSSDKVGSVIEEVGSRRGELTRMETSGGQTHLEFLIPARGLIGLRTRLLNTTAGDLVMHHFFHAYAPMRGEVPRRASGVLVSNAAGRAVAYALEGLQDRGVMFIRPGDDVYPGMIVAEHCRDNDLVVNPCRERKLTNIRAASADKNILLKPPREMSLEMALEYIEEDELVEVTPKAVRLRKRLLAEEDRKRASRDSRKAAS